MTFSEFCKLFQAKPNERQELVYCLAAYRHRKTIELLKINPIGDPK